MKHGPPFVLQGVSSIRELLVIAKVCLPLLRVITSCWPLMWFIGISESGTDGSLTPLETYMESSGTMSPHREGFLISSRSDVSGSCF